MGYSGNNEYFSLSRTPWEGSIRLAASFTTWLQCGRHGMCLSFTRRPCPSLSVLARGVNVPHKALARSDVWGKGYLRPARIAWEGSCDGSRLPASETWRGKVTSESDRRQADLYHAHLSQKTTIAPSGRVSAVTFVLQVHDLSQPVPGYTHCYQRSLDSSPNLLSTVRLIIGPHQSVEPCTPGRNSVYFIIQRDLVLP